MVGIKLVDGEILGPVVQLPGATGKNKPMRQTVMKVDADGIPVFDRDVYFFEREGVFILECTVHSVVAEAEKRNAEELEQSLSVIAKDSLDVPVNENATTKGSRLSDVMVGIVDPSPRPSTNDSAPTAKSSRRKPLDP